MIGRSFLRLLPLCLWSFIILWLSLSSDPFVPDTGLFGWDKFQHAMAYGLLSFLWGLTLFPKLSRSLNAWLLGFVLSCCYGGMLELLQIYLTAARYGEWGDLLADAIGAAVFSFFGFMVSKGRFSYLMR